MRTDVTVIPCFNTAPLRDAWVMQCQDDLYFWRFAGELARMPRSRLDAAIGEEKVSRQTCVLAAVVLIICSQSYGSLELVHAHATDAAAMWHGMCRRGGWRGWRGGWTTRR